MGKALWVGAALVLAACGGGDEQDPRDGYAVLLARCEAPLAPEFGTRGSVSAVGTAVYEDATATDMIGYVAEIALVDDGGTGDTVSEQVRTTERIATHVFPGDSGGWHVANLRVEFDVSGASMRLSQVDTLLTRNISCPITSSPD